MSLRCGLPCAARHAAPSSEHPCDTGSRMGRRISSVDAREVSYARVCLAVRPFRLFQSGDRYVHVMPGQDVGLPVLVLRAERGRPAQTDNEHVWLPPLEHWCAGIAGQVRRLPTTTFAGGSWNSRCSARSRTRASTIRLSARWRLRPVSTPPEPEWTSRRSPRRCRASRRPTGGADCLRCSRDPSDQCSHGDGQPAARRRTSRCARRTGDELLRHAMLVDGNAMYWRWRTVTDSAGALLACL